MALKALRQEKQGKQLEAAKMKGFTEAENEFAAELEEQQAAIACSLDNPDNCEMCSG